LSWKVNSLSWALVLLAMRSPERSLTMAWLYWRVTIFMPLLCCHISHVLTTKLMGDKWTTRGCLLM
jgi:hypothetical protein